MIDKNRIIPVATLLLIGMLVTGPLVGFTNGQILTEKTYYEEDFEQYNETAVQIVADDELQSQYLTNTGNWTGEWDGNDIYNRRDPAYGGQDAHRRSDHIDTRQPWLSVAGRNDGHDTLWVGMNRTLQVPDNMQNPTLVVEHASNRHSGGRHGEVAVYGNTTENGQVITTRNFDQSTGYLIERTSPYSRDDFEKVGTMDRPEDRPWTTSLFEVAPANDEVSVHLAVSGRHHNNHWEQGDIRNLYWTEGSADAFSATVEGYESIPEDDSFGGPDPYKFALINEPTAEGKETSLRSFGSNVERSYTLDGISTNPQKVYFELDATSHSNQPINWRIEQYGQDVATGSISPQSSAEDTAELELNDDEFTLYVESGGHYDIHGVSVTALEETSEGDPLASEGPIVLDAQSGYDNTIGMFIDALDITTTTLLYIVMIALIIGAMAFSYTKSVRGQEFGQSMMYGAIITGVVMVGLVPTMNAATWIFTGGTDRAPLANPSLEAEPPTYYSTEFQAGTMDGWESTKGMARPVSSGEGFNLEMTEDGESAVVQRQVHISLGNSLDTGFVRLGATASSTPGYTSNPHETSLRMRVYVTDGGEPNWESKTSDLTDDDLSNYDDLVVAQEWARSFDGQVVNEEGTVSFPLEGNTIYVEIVADDNRNDELASGSVNWIAVGATTEGTGEAV